MQRDCFTLQKEIEHAKKKWASGAHLQEYSQNHDATKKPTMLSTLSLEGWQIVPAIYEINKTQFIIHWWAITIAISNWNFKKRNIIASNIAAVPWAKKKIKQEHWTIALLHNPSTVDFSLSSSLQCNCLLAQDVTFLGQISALNI